MIFDGAGVASPDIETDEISSAGDSGPWPIFDDHQRLAAEKLRAAPDAYLKELHRLLEGNARTRSIPHDAESTVRWFCECPAGEDQILDLFLAVREALDAVPLPEVSFDERGRAEEAASALFFLAACRLVNREAHLASVATGNNRHVVLVPHSEHILCGVIATALFGGELRLTTSEQLDGPAPEYLFKVHVPAGADERVSDFERAAYVAILSGDRKETEISIDAGPLSERERSKLKARIRTIRKRKHRSLALVVHGLTQGQAAVSLPVALHIPVLLPDTEATKELLGMNPSDLLVEIEELWDEFHQMRGLEPPASSETPVSEPTGASTMPPPTHELNIGTVENLSIASDHSAAQSGTGHTARIGHRQGTELSALLPQIAAAINDLGSDKAREALNADARTLKAEVGKGNKADPGVARRALDAIKSGARVLQEGGKIVQLCDKALEFLASRIG